ncbi:M20/M25/M40 family metallo-hydrolase [Sinanaerobacter chloroacetimidivorans]|uniref:M20/M25/M40 family metallo-hydrolase n=1 Tax=Sinanaerobacter chloroacetimidivorans TaxID=2818044 RepID=A0A8J7W371_9FIRM|nr:M20/M25/M40 family metallo-hydrolase [Sinanaerobacter chloroacetimidivorans]MBR0598261.1 M20/M25/M40 family metallo-hydrolase [Sinanaerobacter chloroacetimidivorans]
MSTKVNLSGIEEDIQDLLEPFLTINSQTGTDGEKECEDFILNYYHKIPYFQEHKEHYGSYEIAGDPLSRSVCWAMVRGEGPDTVILIHHYDIVDIEDFKGLKDYAFQPEALEGQLLPIADTLQDEAREDLLSGDYLFGRGTADMKAGGAIQMALLKRYSQMTGLKGNLLVLSLPDEENISSGMRAGVSLLTELREKHGLKYVYAFNSEPHQRKAKDVGVLSEGSVGKLMAFVYVRGFLAHIGKVFEGLNPLGLLAEMVAQTELSPLFSDRINSETSPPPTWLYFRDRKEEYNVSIPLGAGGCVSVLTLNSDPLKILEALKEVGKEAFETVLSRMNDRYHQYCEGTGKESGRLPWKSSAMTFDELVREAGDEYGEEFQAHYKNKLTELNEKIKAGEIDLMESSFQLTEFVYHYIRDLSPRIIIGFVPPYYPNVSNLFLREELPDRINILSESLCEFSREHFGESYDREYFYTGISDMSYFSLKNSDEISLALKGSMPLYGNAYHLPLNEIESLSVPTMNIGPWGKDFHKLTERVLRRDVFERTPALLNKAIEIVLNQK